jgi:ABC-2 type transport system permease protein
VVGIVLFAVLISVAHVLFGTVWGTPALWFMAVIFILANLALGLTLSFLASTQMQAMQMGVLFYFALNSAHRLHVPFPCDA